MIRVYIDGTDKPEALRLVDLLNIKGERQWNILWQTRAVLTRLPNHILAIAQEPHGIQNGRISQHYLAALTAVFEDFPAACKLPARCFAENFPLRRV